MSSDAYWFKHDSNASRDLKLMQIKAIYGYEGIGIFWAIIEVLREQSNYRWEEAQLQILSKIIDCEYQKLNNLITDCKRILLIGSDGKYLFSNRLIEDMIVWESKKSNRKGKNKTDGERNNNGIKTEEEDKRTEEDNNKINISFKEFWDLYNNKKGDKDRCEKKWTKLKNEERVKIIQTLPKFLSRITDKQYQPHPLTYINAKRWNDDLNALELNKPNTHSGLTAN